MKRIGTKANAQRLVQWLDTNGYSGAPEGWKELGAGCSRTAYLGPDGYVYKVGDDIENAREAEPFERWLTSGTLHQLRDLGVTIPAMRAVTVTGWDNFYDRDGERTVLIAEYVDAKTFEFSCNIWMGDDWGGGCDCGGENNRWGRCIDKIRQDIHDLVGLEDLHGENVLVRESDGFLFIVDIAI